MGYWADVIRTRPDANPIPDGTAITFKTVSDNVVQLSTTIGAVTSGMAVWQVDGWPGDSYYEVTYPAVSGETRRHTSQVVGPAGSANLGEFPYLLRCFTPGVIRNDRGALAPSKHATTMTINIADGSCVGKYGMTYTQYSLPKALSIANNGTGSDRTDLIVCQFGRSGSGGLRKNQTQIIVKQGTPGSGAPSLIDNSDIYELLLATVLIPAGVSNISGVTLTDNRTYWETPPSAFPTHVTLGSTKRKRDNAPIDVVALSGSNGQDIGSIQQSITLENGITYDIVGRSSVWALAPNYNSGAATANRDVETAIYLGDLANVNENVDERWVGHSNKTDYLPIWNSFTRTAVVGTGAAITCGVRIRSTNNSLIASYINAVFEVQAVPRPRQ